MTIYLHHTEGSRKGRVDSFDLERVRIGRHPDNDLRFDPEADREVSGHHAEIACQGDAFFIQDLQSRNGTFVNGRKIDQSTRLADGSIIQFSLRGPKVVFSLTSPEAQPAPPAERRAHTIPPAAPAASASAPRRLSRFLTVVGLVLAAMAWVAALILAALWSRWSLFIVVAVAGVAGGGGFFLWWWMHRRREACARQAPVPDLQTEAEARGDAELLGELRRKWTEGLTTLHSGKLQQRGEDATYAVPWVLMLGEPGSGKTEAIRAANPLSWLSSSGKNQGLGGTRTCDWWFFEKSVILDTAGRYAAQSDGPADGREWHELMMLLRRTRAREPLNGVVVAVAADALASRPVNRLQDQAILLRRRLDDLQGKLGTTFPVYLLVTKMDLLPGFADFFGGLPEGVRGQAMGAAADEADGRAGAAVFFDRGFRWVSEKLDRLRLARMDEEEGAEVERRLYLFPEEFRALRGPLRAFAEALFRPNPYHETPALRGMFFTSARQGGVPLSRLAPGLGFQDRSPAPTPAAGPFFARDVFAVILSEDRPLAGRTAQWQERAQRSRTALFAATAAACLVLAGLLTVSFIRNYRALARLDLGACIKIAAPAADGAVSGRLPGLDACRRTIQDFALRSFWGRVFSNFGLSVVQRIEEPLQERYLQTFRAAIADPLDARLEQKLAPGAEAPLYVSALLQRIRLLDRCRAAEGCPPDDASARPIARAMLAVEAPGVNDADPRVDQLARTQDAFLRWQPDPRAYDEMRARQIQRVTGWLQQGGLRPDLILASASAQFPPVRYRDFWGGDITGQVASPYTRRAWAEGIQPLLAGLKAMAPESKDIQEALTRFEASFRAEAFRQWEQFLTYFPQAERLALGRAGWRELARAVGPESPYRRVLKAAGENLAPLLWPAPQEADNPAWALTLRRYGELLDKLPDPQKARQKPPQPDHKAKPAEDDREMLGYLAGYLEALDQLRGEMASPEKAYRGVQVAFQEGEPSDQVGKYALQRAIWNRERLRQAIGRRQGEDRIVWLLAGRPADLAWRGVLDQAGAFLQTQWDVVNLRLRSLAPAQRPADVVEFAATGPAAPFLERQRGGAAAKTLQGQGVPFTPAFLEYVNRASRATSPEEFDRLGRIDPPRQIVSLP